MTRNFLALLFSFSLIFSILAPSALNLLNLEYDEVTLMDIAEKESKKEVETGIDEDIKIVQSLLKAPSFYLEEANREFSFYKENTSIYATSVHLPPPEFNA